MADDGAGPVRVKMFASLAIRNYRLFFLGGFVSNVGTWMGRIAQDWLVLVILTQDSSIALGLVTALQFLPSLLMLPWAGAAADRFDKRKLLIWTQTAMMFGGLLLAILVLGGWIQLWQVFVLAFVTGCAASFDVPARQAFAPEMVSTELITNAVGLNTISFNVGRLIGPAIAGVSIFWWGVGPALLVNALSFLTVVGSLFLMDVTDLHPSKPVAKKGAVRDGIKYVRRRSDIIVLLFIIFMLGTFGMNFQITNTLMSKVAFGLGPDALGLLSSIMAVGSVAAGLMTARRSRPRLRLILISMVGFCITTALLAFAPNYLIYAIILIPTGYFALTVMTCCNSGVQLATAPQMRGRVMALYMAIFMGGTPLGSPVIGWIGEVFGPRWALAVGPIACGITVLVVVTWAIRSGRWEIPFFHRSNTAPIVEPPQEAR